MKDKFLEWEDRIFTAPYRWLITKGYIVAKKIYLTMDDLYQAKILDEYRETRIGQEMTDKYYCRLCKEELSKADVLIICDECIYGDKI